MVNRRPGEKKKEMTNQATISQELQAVLLTNIGHSIQRTGVDERELAIKRERQRRGGPIRYVLGLDWIL